MMWLQLNWPQALELLWAHLTLAIPAIVLSAIIAIPVGRFAFRSPRIGGPLLSTATLLYAIPALPMLIIVPVIFGVGLRSPATMIIALTAYACCRLAGEADRMEGYRR